MASSANDDDLYVGGPRNFYCHQCHSRTRVSAEEFTCASCGSGFIEEITHVDDDDDDDGQEMGGPEEPWDVQMPFGGDAFLQQLLGPALGGGRGGPGFMIRRGGPPAPQGGGGGGARSRVVGAERAAAAAAGQDGGGALEGEEAVEQMFLGDHFLRSLISNLTGVPIGGGMGGGGGGGQISFTFGPMGMMGGGGGAGGNVMYGNPGDYVWGRGGFDAIVTQLLNQMEGSGPPPMTKDTIEKDVPIVKVSQRHIDEKLQCSVCWDDFKLDETVRRLNCEHIFHPDCIIPWLELHATCPVCRKPLTQEAKAAQDRLDREHEGDGGGSDSGGAGGGGGGGHVPTGGANRSTSVSSSTAAESGGGGANGGGAASSSSTDHQAAAAAAGAAASRDEPEQPMDVSFTDAISMVINQLMGPSQPRASAAAGAAAATPSSSASRPATQPAAASSSSSSSNAANTTGNSSDQPTDSQRNRQHDFQDFEPE